MIHHLLGSLYGTLFLPLFSLVRCRQYARYPSASHLAHSVVTPDSPEYLERMLFNLLAHSPLLRVWQDLDQPLAIVAGLVKGNGQLTLRVNAYRLVAITKSKKYVPCQTHFSGMTQIYHYRYQNGHLRHALRVHGGVRNLGYHPADPLMSYSLPLSLNSQREIEEFTGINPGLSRQGDDDV